MLTTMLSLAAVVLTVAGYLALTSTHRRWQRRLELQRQQEKRLDRQRRHAERVGRANGSLYGAPR